MKWSAALPVEDTAPPRWNRWRVYRFLCACLARCLGGTLPPVPENVPWELLIGASGEHNLTPALAWALRDAPVVPEAVQAYFEGMLALNRMRNARMDETLAGVLEILGRDRSPSLLLKGAASLAAQLYPDRGIRLLTDLDILVPPDRSEAAFQLLLHNGFVFNDPEERNALNAHHHLPGLRHAGTGVAVEIHRHILVAAYRDIFSATEAWTSAQAILLHGRPTHVLSPTGRFVHAVMHTQLQDNNFHRKTLSLRQFLEIAALVHRHEADIDWPEVITRFERHGHGRILRVTCEIVAGLFGATFPVELGPSGLTPLQDMQRRIDSRPLQRWLLLKYGVQRIAGRPARALRLFTSHRLRHHLNNIVHGSWW